MSSEAQWLPPTLPRLTARLEYQVGRHKTRAYSSSESIVMPRRAIKLRSNHSSADRRVFRIMVVTARLVVRCPRSPSPLGKYLSLVGCVLPETVRVRPAFGSPESPSGSVPIVVSARPGAGAGLSSHTEPHTNICPWRAVCPILIEVRPPMLGLPIGSHTRLSAYPFST